MSKPLMIAALAVASTFATLNAPHAQTLSSSQLAQRTIERRAIEAINWGMPAVNYDLMLQEMLSKTPGKVNQVIYWSRPLDWHNQTLTPNPDAIYFMAFFNTKEGPVVVEVPPSEGGSLNANFVDIWQAPLEDAGLYGVDKGAGIKFLIVPPGYSDAVPDGYTLLRPHTFGSYALLRSNLASHGDADVAKSVAYGKRIKVYPFSQADNPQPTTFTDAADVVFDSTIRYDASFFASLDRIVQSEPWLDRDRAMIDPLRSLGIEKGKPFNPDATTKAALAAGAREAKAWLEAKYDAGLPEFYPGSRWTVPALPELVAAVQTDFSAPDKYPVDVRGLTYSIGYIGIKRLGAGQFYLISIKDKDGNALDGGKSYRLTVSPNAPVGQYWSATVYDRATHALVRDLPRASRSSQIPDMQKNADGSVDVYFGPNAPNGKESNWVPTKSGGGFEVMFRAYAPTKAFFDKTWKLSDIERMADAVDQKQTVGQSPKVAAVPVTVDNFIRAESDLYMSNMVKDGGFGKLIHRREPASIDNQTVIRLNRDTLYTSGVFDLDAGPVTVTLPDAGKRFMSLMVLNEDHYVPAVFYGAGSHTFTKEKVGTRYMVVGIRTLVNPADPKDVEQVHALQDAIKVSQAGSGKFEAPNWDAASQKKVRDALLVLASTMPDFKKSFGTKDQVDPVRHLVASAAAWGGNPDKDATYLNITPTKNDGTTIYRLNVKDVPVDAFWSVSVYNAAGYYEKNAENAYTLNNLTAKKSDDGSVAIQFGGCDGKIPNCLPIVPGWNYTARLYRPRAEILNGKWKFPEPQPAS
jgi:hypothetical protein